jgi:hypothetical protein|nr:hypothetical protein [uncultured Psychroserpens sp.]
MFTYKRLFWLLLVSSIALSLYQYNDRDLLELDITIRDMRLSTSEHENRVIGELATRRLYTFQETENFLSNNYYASDGVVTDGDTIFLERTYLLFKNDSLVKIDLK